MENKKYNPNASFLGMGTGTVDGFLYPDLKTFSFFSTLDRFILTPLNNVKVHVSR